MSINRLHARLPTFLITGLSCQPYVAQGRRENPNMRTPFLLTLFLVTLIAATGQTTESQLKDLYGEPVDGVFSIKPDVKLKAFFNAARQACVLTISGPRTEKELMQVFDMVVPQQMRGAQKSDLTECAGGCERVMQFEKVELTSGVMDHWQTSEPAAIITFTNTECETQKKNANITLSLKHQRR